MNQLRMVVSLRDFLMLVAGVLLSLLLRPSAATEVRAAGPADLGLACGDWVMQTDQVQSGTAQFDAFVLNVKTGELRRTRGGGKEMAVVSPK